MESLLVWLRCKAGPELEPKSPGSQFKVKVIQDCQLAGSMLEILSPLSSISYPRLPPGPMWTLKAQESHMEHSVCALSSLILALLPFVLRGHHGDTTSFSMRRDPCSGIALNFTLI
jgi:hypothetical protein